MAVDKKTIIKYLKNKYIIATCIFLALILFFDRNDLFVQLQRKHELNKILASKEFYLKQIDSTKEQLEELHKNNSTMEKYAREQLYMKKDSEEVFIVDPNETDNDDKN
jgi:cell division protein DivIC